MRYVRSAKDDEVVTEVEERTVRSITMGRVGCT